MSRHLTRLLYPNATKVMVVYSKQTGVRRRTIDADDDAEYAAHEATLHPGEGFFYLTHAEYDAHDNVYVLNHTTVTKAGFRNATIDYAHDGVPKSVTVNYGGGQQHPKGKWNLSFVDRHAVVAPDGLVIASVHADLTCGDSGEHIAPGHSLIQHPDAGPGWSYDGSNFTNPYPPYLPPSQRPPQS